MTKVAERAFLDTNVLLAATDEGREGHYRADAALNEWPESGVALYSSGQVLREYLCVATRPVASNGLGLARLDAVENARSLRTRLRLLTEDEKVNERLLDLLAETDCTGKQIHDANIVATMLAHGVETLVTANPADFELFEDRIAIERL